eukprot:1150059-Rhodomonas_salina.1
MFSVLKELVPGIEVERHLVYPEDPNTYPYEGYVPSLLNELAPTTLAGLLDAKKKRDSGLDTEQFEKLWMLYVFCR